MPKKSPGPKSELGKAIASQNNFRFGFTGAFRVLAWESEEEFQILLDTLHPEHQLSTPTESLLVERMAQYYWLSQRALYLQDLCIGDMSLDDAFPNAKEGSSLALYLRYQVTHERAFHKCLNDLLKLRSERRKQQIGSE